MEINNNVWQQLFMTEDFKLNSEYALYGGNDKFSKFTK